MGEVVLSSEGGDGGGGVGGMALELEVEEGRTQTEVRREDGVGSSASSVVRWERFLPRMVLRVLLVEADDSTRQIITALLRKCSYKVAAVPDGLKAWEVLKGRSHNIDLILTEVELPLISGYALLTLIMEHEICKNIPVIMMSSQDSVSTVYKCMLRGAADFLVKPVRKNELRNLWQHVWRRQVQSNGGGVGQQDESVAQQKVEAIAENNDVSNHSSGNIACIRRNRECIEKGSDVQSSCTKPDMEADGAHLDMQDHAEPQQTRQLSMDVNIQAKEGFLRTNKLLKHNCEAVGGPVSDAYTMQNEKNPHAQQQIANAVDHAFKSSHGVVNSSREAIDLIGAFDNYVKSSYRSCGSNYGTNKGNSSLFLDLSLRRPHPSGSVNQVNDERHKLNHSDASAFSRYINKAVQPQLSTSPSTCNQKKDCELNSDKPFSDQAHDYESDTHGPVPSPRRSILPLMNCLAGQAEISFPCPQQRVFPVPIQARSIRVESLCTARGRTIPATFCTKSGSSPAQSSGSAGHQGPSFQMKSLQSSNLESGNFQPHLMLMEQTANVASEQTENTQRLGLLEYRGHVLSTTDQTTSSGLCNAVSPVPMVRTAGEFGNEEVSFNHEGSTHRSLQREAALTKFRLKRKERCFEKKVRYESRKKLAEQRPRVKGQFVRQVQNESPTFQTTSNDGDNLPTG